MTDRVLKIEPVRPWPSPPAPDGVQREERRSLASQAFRASLDAIWDHHRKERYEGLIREDLLRERIVALEAQLLDRVRQIDVLDDQVEAMRDQAARADQLVAENRDLRKMLTDRLAQPGPRLAAALVDLPAKKPANGAEPTPWGNGAATPGTDAGTPTAPCSEGSSTGPLYHRSPSIPRGGGSDVVLDGR